jgi:hypothetical protein
MSAMKDFRIEVRFKPILKVSWFGPNVKGDLPFQQRQHIDVNETLVLDPRYEAGKFVTAYLKQSTSGMVLLVLNDEAQYRMLEGALKEARQRDIPAPFEVGHKPKVWVKNKAFRRRKKR